MRDKKSSHKPIIAAFDFDGTMTTKDTLLPFLTYAAGYWPVFHKLVPLIPPILGYLAHRVARQRVKEMILTQFFKGIPHRQFLDLGQSFAHSHAFRKHIRPLALKRLQWHLQQNHQCVLVSAAIETYLKPWHKEAGFSALLCSQPEIDASGTVTGKLVGINCWGAEKVRRLLDHFGPKENFTLYAYGDSLGDQELLALADHSFFKPDWTTFSY